MQHCEFRNDRAIGYGSGFHVGNGIIATAGHCVFKEFGRSELKPDFVGAYFVFGLSKSMAEKAMIPEQNVYKVER
jgi:hypothetical protein